MNRTRTAWLGRLLGLALLMSLTTLVLSQDKDKDKKKADDKDKQPGDLRVFLPADAKLYLAGHKTKTTGEVREFSTTKLPNGSELATYAIRAVVDRDGHEEVREQTVSLKAGESREVTISFDSPASDKVAETALR